MSGPPPYDSKGAYPGGAAPYPYPADQGYGQPQSGYGGPPLQQQYGQYPQYGQTPPQQPSYSHMPPQQSTVNVNYVQPLQPTTLVVAGCNHVFVDDYDCCAIALAIIFFPIGFLCCLCMKRSKCIHCGAIV